MLEVKDFGALLQDGMQVLEHKEYLGKGEKEKLYAAENEDSWPDFVVTRVP